MQRIWFDRHEPTIIDHRLTAAAGNAQRAKGSDAAASFGHVRIPLEPIMLVDGL
jgi:hypothetical protein